MARNDTSNIFKNYPDALTLGEFAEMLGISQKLASKLIRTGEIDDLSKKELIDRKHAINLFKLRPMPYFCYGDGNADR